MKKYPSLSEADSVIMEILWNKKETTSRDILNQTENSLGWSRQTVKTYLDRLQEKGLVKVRRLSPRVHFYSAAVSKEEYASEITSSYVRKYFGDLSHMMAGLIKREDISDEELDNLEQIIKEYRNKN
jgi:BlaI family penicillinase repressor